MIYFSIFILTVMIFFSSFVLYALYWAAKNGQMRDLEKSSTVIFDADEPIGKVTDHFPNT